MKLREKEKTDWWKKISKEEKNTIEQGIRDADSGKLKSHTEAKKLYEKWL
ncbi:hypothetical protein RM545_17260 [Zunongwangia sp. F260]|uniref:Uncharacterized protein n=1 Tax=Autumnicola lenta TaxID=3075593 RepID=A0ABU3CQ15_9FLAO|nr:hypothetical protein [Zunongwangia sp. F260]MDT0648439.1 hypothetical protein [Zunongwangia sp. F260]